MPKRTDIERVKEIDDVNAGGPVDVDSNISDKTAKGEKKSIAGIAVDGDNALERIFKKAKKTILGKNKAGKTLHGLVLTAVGLFTGINIEPITQTLNQPDTMDFLTDFNIWGFIGAGVAILFGYLKTKTGSKLDAVIDDAESGMQLFIEFKNKKSDGGKKVTEKEKDLLIEHFAKIFEKQVKKDT